MCKQVAHRSQKLNREPHAATRATGTVRHANLQLVYLPTSLPRLHLRGSTPAHSLALAHPSVVDRVALLARVVPLISEICSQQQVAADYEQQQQLLLRACRSAIAPARAPAHPRV